MERIFKAFLEVYPLQKYTLVEQNMNRRNFGGDFGGGYVCGESVFFPI